MQIIAWTEKNTNEGVRLDIRIEENETL